MATMTEVHTITVTLDYGEYGLLLDCLSVALKQANGERIINGASALLDDIMKAG